MRRVPRSLARLEPEQLPGATVQDAVAEGHAAPAVGVFLYEAQAATAVVVRRGERDMVVGRSAERGGDAVVAVPDPDAQTPVGEGGEA